MTILLASLFGFGVVSGLLSWWAWRLSPDNLARWERLPRDARWGVLLGLAGLLWCIPHVRPILPSGWHGWLLPLALLSAWLGYMYLDYLFARALGGVMILAAHFFLAAGFAGHAPLRGLSAAAFLAMGTLGIFFCGKPYWLRDLIRRLAGSRVWRHGAGAVLAGYAVLGLALGAWYATRGG